MHLNAKFGILATLIVQSLMRCRHGDRFNSVKCSQCQRNITTIFIIAEATLEDDASTGETSTACHASENDGTSLFREEHKEAILTICRHGCLTTTGVEHPISNKKCDWKVAERHCYFISCLKGSRREWGCTTWHGQEHCDAVNKMFGSECACHYGEQDESLPYFPDSHLQDEVSEKFTYS